MVLAAQLRRSDGREPGSRHIVQLYEDDAYLVEVLVRLIGASIGAGQPALVIATEAHRQSLCQRLRAHAVDVERARAAGLLTLVDARATLERICPGGMDPETARAQLATLLDDAAGACRDRELCIYGEVVDLLWRDGRRDDALTLEAVWNELARTRPFTLVCGYAISNFDDEAGGPLLARVCELHTHTQPTERFSALDGDPERTREIALLEQRAHALESEAERRKKLESELHVTRRRFDEFLDTAVVPMHALATDGRILWANQAELDLLGYAREEYVGRNIAELHVDAGAVEPLLQRLSRGEALHAYPVRLRHKDGTIRHALVDSKAIEEHGELVHTRCFLRDITARVASEEKARRDEAVIRDFTMRHAAEGKLRESETRMRLLIDSIRDYAIFMLDPQGNVATWNPGAQRIKGYQAAEIVGRHFSTFYPPEDVAGGKCEMELAGAAATGRFEDEGWRVRKDGTYFWANVVISAVRDEEGRLLGFAKVTRDLTDRRRAEEERAALVAAREANRAKDEFLAMLGHELRNPLAPIVTALQLMKLRGDIRTTKEQVIIERQVQHVVRLVDDLLDVSRITQGKIELKRETMELAEIVARSVEIASPLLEQRRHELAIDVPRKGMSVHGDPVRLSQVVTNLLTNAAKYTEVEGKISLKAWRDGHEIVIQVKDNGVGIHPDLLPRIFDLFVQGPRSADRSEGGLGLGLTLVRNLVHMHGGTVVALSDGPGTGSAFVVRLPAARPELRDDEERDGAGRGEMCARSRRVLIVDDNVDAATLLAELCASIGHDVRVAHDGPQALELLTRFAPEIAVLDIGLPVMDGYELAKRVHEQLGDACRLIALTGYGQEHDRRRSEQSGFAAHLVKPVAPDRILKLLDE